MGHRDRARAIREAYEFLSGLAVTEKALEEERLTLGLVRELYLQSVQHLGKQARTQQHDAQKLRRVVAFLGPNRDVASLSESDLRRYTMVRRTGAATLEHVAIGRAVRDRTVEADLKLLVGALHWATRERTSTGRRLLREHPLVGVRLPKELNPQRPVMSHEVYATVLEVAREVHPLLELALVVAEGTGRRLSAWRNLRCYDINFRAGTIRWREEFDKQGYEQLVPMSKRVAAALRRTQKAQGAIGAAPVFPAPRDSSTVCDRHLLDRWLRRAFTRAEVDLPTGGLWHALRRKWATERKGYPIRDVAAAGGWRDERTILRSYQQTDSETIKRVVVHPTQRFGGV